MHGAARRRRRLALVALGACMLWRGCPSAELPETTGRARACVDDCVTWYAGRSTAALFCVDSCGEGGEGHAVLSGGFVACTKGCFIDGAGDASRISDCIEDCPNPTP
jgi:hypothetical protein